MNNKLFFLLLLATTTLFADCLILENQTSYPTKGQKTKIAVQWASSAKEVNENNNAILQGSDLKSDSLQSISRSGKVTLNIPSKAEYFRVLVWSTGTGNPDLLTNWVDVVPNKIYTLNADHLVPTVLMQGSGC